jgi:hypothetical protein
MKNWIILILFFPLASFAQDTCGLKKTKDPFTHVTKLSTGFKKFDGNNLVVSISADATPAEIDFFIWVKNEGKCFDSESEAQMVWEGEKRKTSLKNTGSMNCEGAFHFIYKNSATTPSWLNRMAIQRIASIKLTGSNNAESMITFTEEQKALFQKMAICIVAEAKALRGQ